VAKDQQNNNEAVEANKKMDEKFHDYGARASAPAESEADMANQKIQEVFYGNDEADNSLPVHVDVNNPPISK